MGKTEGISKIILGLGYTLAALIILFNFLGQKPEPKPKPGAIEIQFPTDYESLKSQLEEKRRENGRLKEMLEELQKGFEGKQPVRNNFDISSVPEVDPEKLLNQPIPTVRPEVFRPQSARNPFQPGKNPYLPFYDVTELASSSLPSPARTAFPFRTDSRIPFLLRGSLVPTKVREMPTSR